MYFLSYERKEISTGQSIMFEHRCMSEGVLKLAIDDYSKIDLDIYEKGKLRVIEGFNSALI